MTSLVCKVLEHREPGLGPKKWKANGYVNINDNVEIVGVRGHPLASSQQG